MFLFLHFELVPSVPNRYINKLCLIMTSSCMKLIITNIEAKVGIYLKEKILSYSYSKGIWALI